MKAIGGLCAFQNAFRSSSGHVICLKSVRLDKFIRCLGRLIT